MAKEQSINLDDFIENSKDELEKIGIRAAFSICNKPLSLEKAMQETNQLLVGIAENVVSLIQKN